MDENDGKLCPENDAWDDIDLSDAENEEREVEPEQESVSADAAKPKSEENSGCSDEAERMAESNSGTDTSGKAADDEKQLESLVKTNPALASARAPKEVLAKIRNGMSAREAYISYQNDRLKAENMALRQAQQNSNRLIGSADSSGKRKTDSFDEEWYDGN